MTSIPAHITTGTAAEWAESSAVLEPDEPGFVVDDAGVPIGMVKGDGETIASELVPGDLGGSGPDPIVVEAPEGEVTDLSEYIGESNPTKRPILVVCEGDTTRGTVEVPDPVAGQSVLLVPKSAAATLGPTIRWARGPQPGILADLAAAYANYESLGSLDFSAGTGTPMTAQITVDGGSPIDVVFDDDWSTFDLPTDLGTFITAVANKIDDAISSVADMHLDAVKAEDVVGGRWNNVQWTSKTTGDGSSVVVTDPGSGDRLLLSLLTSTPGVDQFYEGWGGGIGGTGDSNVPIGFSEVTHAWHDGNKTNFPKGLGIAGTEGDRPTWDVWWAPPRAEFIPMPYPPYDNATIGNTSSVATVLNDFDPAISAAATAVGTSFDASGLSNTDAEDVQEAIADLDGAISAGGISASIVDAKGDLIVGTADDTVSRLAAGTDGHVLKAASGETEGVEWGTLDAEDVGAIAAAGDATTLWLGTETEYAAIMTPDANTVYVVVEDP